MIQTTDPSTTYYREKLAWEIHPRLKTPFYLSALTFLTDLALDDLEVFLVGKKFGPSFTIVAGSGVLLHGDEDGVVEIVLDLFIIGLFSFSVSVVTEFLLSELFSVLWPVLSGLSSLFSGLSLFGGL